MGVEEATEYCWTTGNFTDECMCEMCAHREECSGSDYDDEE